MISEKKWKNERRLEKWPIEIKIIEKKNWILWNQLTKTIIKFVKINSVGFGKINLYVKKELR